MAKSQKEEVRREEPKKKSSFLGRWFKRLIMLAILVALGLGGLFKHQEGKWVWDAPKEYLEYSKDKLTFAYEKTKETSKDVYEKGKEVVEDVKDSQRSDEEESTSDEESSEQDPEWKTRYFKHYEAGQAAYRNGKDMFARAQAPANPDKAEDLGKALEFFQQAKGEYRLAKEANPEDQDLDARIREVNRWIVDVEKAIKF